MRTPMTMNNHHPSFIILHDPQPSSSKCVLFPEIPPCCDFYNFQNVFRLFAALALIISWKASKSPEAAARCKADTLDERISPENWDHLWPLKGIEPKIEPKISISDIC